MNSIALAAGIVAPMAIKMCIGVVAKATSVIEKSTMRKVDNMTFKLLLPILLFINIYEANLGGNFEWKLFGFASASIVVLFTLVMLVVPLLEKEPKRAAVIQQATVRCNFVIFGLTVANSLYGNQNAGVAALLGTLVIPLATVQAVIILEKQRNGKASAKKMLISILKTPLLIAAEIAILLKLLHIELPRVILAPLEDIGNLGTNISFISLGVSLSFKEFKSDLRSVVIGTVARMVVVPLLFMPLAVLLGFRGQQLCALTVFFVSPAAVSSYPMAVAMDADGDLAGQLVVTTTICSIFTLFIAILLFSSLGWL